MKIKTEIQDPNLMRYNTLGDWFYVPFIDTLVFQVADTGNDEYNKLILIHELIEELLTSHKGIKEEDIMKFDIEHPELDEPGESRLAPYHDEHMLAQRIEDMLCVYMGIRGI